MHCFRAFRDLNKVFYIHTLGFIFGPCFSDCVLYSIFAQKQCLNASFVTREDEKEKRLYFQAQQVPAPLR